MKYLLRHEPVFSNFQRVWRRKGPQDSPHGVSRQVVPRHPLRNDRVVDFPVVQHDELSPGGSFALGENHDSIEPVRKGTGEVDPAAGKVRHTQEYGTAQKSRAG